MAANESEYTAKELVAAASHFGVRPEVVAAALKRKNIMKTTERNAKKIIEAFRKKEVK